MKIDKSLTLSGIAELLNAKKDTIKKRAQKGKWRHYGNKVQGGQEHRFRLPDLPEEIQSAYAKSKGISLPELLRQLQPDLGSDPEFNKKVVISRYSCRARPAKKSKPFYQVTSKGREKAHLKAKIIDAWSASKLSPEEFCEKYNSDQIVPELRKAMGSKKLSKSTLYRWMQKYTHEAEEGLAPQHATWKGGNGAALDPRTKGLIWFYYLNKNRPGIKKVRRQLDEKEHIKVSESMLCRYIRTEIPESAKIYFLEGEKAWNDKCAPYINIDYTRIHSMQWVVYDHKTFDFASRVKRSDGWHRVRLFLTCIIDKRSRKILGWWVDEVPSTLTVIRATRMMVEQYGCPDGAQTDNGRDFAGYWFAGNAWNEQHLKFGKRENKTVSSVLEDLGMAIQYTTPYRGQSKNIERLFGFMAAEFDKSFDSYLGSNTSDRHEQSKVYLGSFEGAPARPIGELPTLEETRKLFEKFVEWYNSKWNHTGQGMEGKTPDAVFAENLRGRRDIPSDYAKYVWTRREIKTVQKNGIRSEKLWYYNEAMMGIIGQQVELRVSIDDIGTGYIFNLAGEYLYDTSCEFQDTGITEENVRKVKRIRKQASQHLEKYQNAINEIKKDKKTQLEELREEEAAALAEFELKVVNGEPVSVSEDMPTALKLITPKTPKRKIRGIFDVD